MVDLEGVWGKPIVSSRSLEEQRIYCQCNAIRVYELPSIDDIRHFRNTKALLIGFIVKCLSKESIDDREMELMKGIIPTLDWTGWRPPGAPWAI